MNFETHTRVKELLTAGGARWREIAHIAEGRSDEIAAIRGHAPHMAAKAMVLDCRGPCYLAVVPGDCKVSLQRVRAHVGRRASLASLAQVQQLTGCPPGAVPPFSFHPDMRLLVDRGVAVQPEIVFNAGRLDRSVFVATADYLRLAEPAVIDLTDVPAGTAT